jgi:GT2 family glycosyltransferase
MLCEGLWLSMKPSVTSVIVNHNGGDKILRCIDALKTQTVPFDQSIVVDSGSTDGSLDRIRRAHPEVQVVQLGANLGPAAARNAAIDRAAGDVIFWIDHDIYAAPDCLERLLEARATTPAAIVVPRIILYPETEVVQADGGEAHFLGTLKLRNGFTSLNGLVGAVRAGINACPSGCLLMDRRVARAVGGFNESYFFYLEDYEFSLRVRMLGHKIYSEPAALTFHDRGEGTKLAFRGNGRYPTERAHLLMRNRMRTLLTHYALRTLIVLAPALLLYELVILVFALLRGWGGAWFRAWCWQFGHVRQLRDERRALQARRVTPDREILTGGDLPLAPGLLGSPASRILASALSRGLNAYWSVARRAIR